MSLTLLSLFGFISLLLMGLSLPISQGKVKLNKYYGVRIPLTLNNPETWHKVDAYIGRQVLYSGVAILVGSICLYLLFGSGADDYALGMLIIIVIRAVVATISCFRYVISIRKVKP